MENAPFTSSSGAVYQIVMPKRLEGLAEQMRELVLPASNRGASTISIQLNTGIGVLALWIKILTIYA